VQFLADENIPSQVIRALRDRGFDLASVREVAPGMADERILAWAQREKRVLVTLDKDFGELAFRANLPVESGVILVRYSSASPMVLATALVSILASRSDWNGHFSVIESTRVRMLPLR
jgi:predicted nuclease of predicted toxin-antitoxin system